MGIVGGGGSILGVPVLAYLFRMDAVAATTASLFVVGVTAGLGALGHARNGRVNFRTGLLFGVPSVLAVIFQRTVVLPQLPEILLHAGNFELTRNVFILTLFAVLMLFSSAKMIWGTENLQPQPSSSALHQLVLQGIGVGLVTGLVGAGGGFLIVPALVMLQRLDIKVAIGTSMFIIAMNSLLGFVSSPGISKTDWGFLGFFTALSVLGMLIGIGIAKKIDSKKLKTLFGWLVLLMGISILIKELFFST